MDFDEIGDHLPDLRRWLIERWGDSAFTREVLARQVAISLVEKCWRNTTLENWHSANHPDSPSDYDMFRANITLTRAVLPPVESVPLDVDAIREILTDADRPTGCGRSAQEFSGPAWAEVETTAHGMVDVLDEWLDRLGEEGTRVLYACQVQSSGWWGAPGFEDRLRASFARHRPDLSNTEVNALVARPEQMSEKMFRDVVFYKM
jgi:hypothetical protein